MHKMLCYVDSDSQGSLFKDFKGFGEIPLSTNQRNSS